MTILLILTTGSRHWLFSIFLEKAFLHRRLQCSSHYCKSEAQNWPAGRAIVSRARRLISSELRYRGQIPPLLIQSRFRSRNRAKDPEVESRDFVRLLNPDSAEASRRERVGYLPNHAGALDFGFHFPAQKIHQNLDSFFGLQNLCDHGIQSDKGASNDLHRVALR
jgi:hypothetical protein